MSILVVGDAMFDKHTYGECTRLSPERPVPIIDAPTQSDVFLGAAANVAAQIKAAGINCVFAYKEYADRDNSHELLFSMCYVKGIKTVPLFYPKIQHTVTTKERIWSGDQQICRVDREDKSKPNTNTENKWIEELTKVIIERDIIGVVFSDYDKGTLTDRLIQTISDICKERGIFTILDPKRHSFYGLQNLTLIKPNEKEVKITNLTAQQCSEELGETYLLNTLGADGMMLWRNGKNISTKKSQALPSEVVDVCGCGDTVTAFLAIGLYNNKNIIDSMGDANRAAAVNLSCQGCHVLTKKEIEKYI
ncbi:MAG: bifunctional heptose 7-phosphate kinase/heptose 1-phosphate adenyltransferase [Candidatus Hodarchaeales archaeon]|jgi:D-beta-D-heptose 7-phosphate kinase/D-beta-D-heptose 1-phosphate adenosyltransferase